MYAGYISIKSKVKSKDIEEADVPEEPYVSTSESKDLQRPSPVVMI